MSLVRGFPVSILKRGIPSIFADVNGLCIHSIFEYPVPPDELQLEDSPPSSLDRVSSVSKSFTGGVPVINRFIVRARQSKTELLSFDLKELVTYWSPSLIVSQLEMRHWPPILGCRFATGPEAICLLLCNPWLKTIQFKCDAFHGHFGEVRITTDNQVEVVPNHNMTLPRCTFAVSGDNDHALSELSANWIS